MVLVLLENRRFTQLLLGIFRALSNGLPQNLTKNQIKSLFDVLHTFMQKTGSHQKAMKSSALKSMTVSVV